MKRIISIVTAVLLLLVLLTSCAPSNTQMREGLQTLYNLEDICYQDGIYPEEALIILEGYIYAYTGDYREISQDQAETALSVITDYYRHAQDIGFLGASIRD